MAANLALADDSVLLLVDMQTRLAAAIPPADYNAAKQACSKLLQLAETLKIPCLISEQYPQGLGHTDPELKAQFPAVHEVFAKTSFSVSGAETLMQALHITQRNQIVICGMETHVCILQSALQLAARNYQVTVVADAVCARQPQHTHNALQRLQQHHITISNHESVLFEWLGDSKHPAFKQVSALIR